MANKAAASGDAQDADISTAPADGEESAEEHEANIRAKRMEQANAAVESAEAKVKRAQEHLDSAKASVEKMKAHRASLEE